MQPIMGFEAQFNVSLPETYALLLYRYLPYRVKEIWGKFVRETREIVCQDPLKIPSTLNLARSGVPGWRRTMRGTKEFGSSAIKKATGKPRIEYDEAVEEALCFGWVDSKPNKLDDERSMLWFAPRKAGTGWSRPNKQRVEKLIQEGLMIPAGMAKVEAAKQDGSWSALDAIEALEIPPDLGKVLAANPAAKDYFDAFPRSVKRGILEWISNAKKPETRAKRIDETVRLASENKRANQWRQ